MGENADKVNAFGNPVWSQRTSERASVRVLRGAWSCELNEIVVYQKQWREEEEGDGGDWVGLHGSRTTAEQHMYIAQFIIELYAL